MGDTEYGNQSIDSRYDNKHMIENDPKGRIQTMLNSNDNTSTKASYNYSNYPKQNTHSTSSFTVNSNNAEKLSSGVVSKLDKTSDSFSRFNTKELVINTQKAEIKTKIEYKNVLTINKDEKSIQSQSKLERLAQYKNKKVKKEDVLLKKGEFDNKNISNYSRYRKKESNKNPVKENKIVSDFKEIQKPQNGSKANLRINYRIGHGIKIRDGQQKFTTKKWFKSAVGDIFRNVKKEDFTKNLFPRTRTTGKNTVKEFFVTARKTNVIKSGEKLKGKFYVFQGNIKKIINSSNTGNKREKYQKDKLSKNTSLRVKSVRTSSSYVSGSGSVYKMLSGTKTGLSVAKGTIVTAYGTMTSQSDDYAVSGVNKSVRGVDSSIKFGGKTYHTAKQTKEITTLIDRSVRTSNKSVKAKKTASVFARMARQNAIQKSLRKVADKSGKKIAKSTAKFTFKTAIKGVIESIKIALAPLRPFFFFLSMILFLVFILIIIVCSIGILTDVWIEGFFSIEEREGEIKVDEYLAEPVNGVAAYSAQTKEELYQQCNEALKMNGGLYDIVRIKTDTEDGSVFVDVTPEAISNVFYTDIDLIDMIAPMYTSTVYMKYGGNVTEEEATAEVKDLYERLFTISTVATKEYCGQSLTNGSSVAMVACPNCDWIHALDDCPNYRTGYHESMQCVAGSYYDDYVCLGHDDGSGILTFCSTVSALKEPCTHCEARTHYVGCDHKKYTCDGYDELTCEKEVHLHECRKCCIYYGKTHTTHIWGCGQDYHEHIEFDNDLHVIYGMDACYTRYYCEDGALMDSECEHSCTERVSCDGYKFCEGHDVLTYSISLDGMYALINEIYLEPMDTLKSKDTLTKEEEKQLADLEGWYEVFNIIMTHNPRGHMGTGISPVDLKDVKWLESYRKGCDEIINLALSQNGSAGGALYWKDAGFTKRVPWCAIFVNWCFKNTPSVTDLYAKTPNNYSCQTLVNYHRNTGQFHESSDWPNITKGDCIFFDWELDGITDHVGLVIGKDEEFVYTIEGNSGDAVKIKKYSLNSAVIYGYVFIDY